MSITSDMEAVVKQHHLIFVSFVDGVNIILNAYPSHKNCTDKIF